MYGRVALLGSIISRARDVVESFYRLKGTPAEIAADVHWLLEKSRFIFGGVDVKVCLFYSLNTI